MFIRGWFGIEGRPEPRLDAGWPKIAAGYFTDGAVPDASQLAAVKGRGLE